MHMWNGEEEFPPVITVFSAPNYCGSYENKAAVIVSEGEGIDVRSFKEKTNKPYILPSEFPRMNAFTFYHDELMANVLDFMYNMCKKAVGRFDEDIEKVFSDKEYFNKVINMSIL